MPPCASFEGMKDVHVVNCCTLSAAVVGESVNVSEMGFCRLHGMVYIGHARRRRQKVLPLASPRKQAILAQHRILVYHVGMLD